MKNGFNSKVEEVIKENNFKVKFPEDWNLSDLYVSSISKPAYYAIGSGFEEVAFEKWDLVHIEIINAYLIAEEMTISKKLMNLIDKNQNQKLTVEVMGNAGKVFETWEIDFSLSNVCINFGNCDRNNSEFNTIQVDIRPTTVKIK